MGADVSICPVPRLLERLLAEQLDGSDRYAVEAHVERCSSCQERLDELVGAMPDFSASRVGTRSAYDANEPGENFLARLKRPPQTEDTSAAAALEYRRLGQYEILATIGAGGMGTVYKARHVELDKFVALKVLPADRVSEASEARFKQEIRAMGRLEHTNIVAAYDAGEQSGVRYLVMAYVDGIDLARLVERHGPIPINDACELARQSAVGLQHAFERGLVHRDIKPQNLMLARDGTVKVLDLGLARPFGDVAAESLTAAGTMLGTADYLAPEQWDSPQTADIRADIYGLGCTLFHLLAGKPPFAAPNCRTVLKKMQAHQQTPPPAIASVRPEAPAELAVIMERMLAKNPADRFDSPAEVAEALRPFAERADLIRLLGTDTANSPTASFAAATPGPAKWDTPTDRVNLAQPVPASRRNRFPFFAIAGLALLALAAILIGPHLWTTREPNHKPLTVKEMGVSHFRERKQDLGDLRTNSSTVRLLDNVAFSAELSAPAYYYLIAFNPKGSKAGIEQLCLPDDAKGESAPSLVPVAKAEVRFPRDDGLFTVDAAGLQVFVLAVSSKPLPSYAEWRKQAGDPPWKGDGDPGQWRWLFDGKEYTRLPRERGTVVGAPKELRELCDWFKARPEFETIHVFAFPVSDARK